MGNANDPHDLPPFELSVLDRDPAKAEAAYREIREDLRPMLRYMGCVNPEDIIDEAIYRAILKLSAGVDTSSSSARAYVFGVARNVALELFRKSKREPQVHDLLLGSQPSPERGHAQSDARRMLRQALALLSEAERRMLLRYAAEADHAGHAAQLGVTTNYLRLKVFRLRKKLRALIGRLPVKPRAV